MILFAHEAARDVPIIAEPDVLVVGGGAAGIAAAIAASRQGADVMLVERWGFLGGTLTAVTLGGFCGGWAMAPDELIPVVGGIFSEFIARLEKLGGVLPPKRLGHVASLPYDPTRVKFVTDDMTAGCVDVYFHTWMADVAAQEGRVDTVFLENKGGRFAVRPKMVVDASGDGDLAARAGAPFELGDGGITQFGSSMFRMANVDIELFDKLSREDMYKYFEDMVASGTDLPRTAAVIYRHPIPGVVHFNTTKVGRPDGSPFDLTNPKDLSAAEREGRRQALMYETAVRKGLPGFADAMIVDIGPQIGIRETRLIRGDAVLTADDVLNCIKPEDAIACCSWPIEKHGEGRKTVWKHLPVSGYYKIPFGCLLPIGLENVLIAGRCISATLDAHAWVGVSAPVFAMGEAAGVAAAMALKKGNQSRAISVSELQTTLRAQGAIL
jgi:hypothetical protein